MTIRILLADDHALVRGGVRRILEAERDLRVVAEARMARRLSSWHVPPRPDLAVLDISMPRMTGLQAAREIKRRDPSVQTLMLSMHDNEQYFFDCTEGRRLRVRAQVRADEDLVAACRAAMRGESFLYAGVAGTLVRDFLDRMRRGERMPRSRPYRRVRRRWSS